MVLIEAKFNDSGAGDSDVILSLFDQCVQARDTFERTMFNMQRHERRAWMAPLVTLAQHHAQLLEQQLLRIAAPRRRAPAEMIYAPPEHPTLSTCAFMARQVEQTYEHAINLASTSHLKKLLTEQLYGWRTATMTLHREAAASSS